MKLPRKKTLVTGLCLLALAGCDSGDLPHVFGSNEVPPDVMAEPRAVTVPSDAEVQGQNWMRLGDVASMPKDFTPQDQIQQSKQQLINDRSDSTRLRQAADMPLPPDTSATAPSTKKAPPTTAAVTAVLAQPAAAPPQVPVAQNAAQNNNATYNQLTPPQFVHSSVPPPNSGLTSTGLINPYPISPW